MLINSVANFMVMSKKILQIQEKKYVVQYNKTQIKSFKKTI